MKIFNKYHVKRTDKWYFQWSSFTKHEYMLFSIEFNFPTPKDMSLFFAISIFTRTLVFLEIARMDTPKPQYIPDGWS